MPIILGVVLNKKDNSKITHLSRVIQPLIKNHSTNTLTNIKADYWTVTAAVKDQELDQEKIIVLPNNEGIAIGRFYCNTNSSSSVVFECDSIRKTNGKWLVDNYWGRYILFQAINHEINATLFQDTIGLFKIFYLHWNNELYFSSDIALLYEIIKDQHDLEIDWQYFASYVYHGLLHTANTPFKNVRELLPGCNIEFKHHYFKINAYWNFTKNIRAHNDFSEIIPTLKLTTNRLVENSPTVCLQLSGGLDSTAIYLILKDILARDQKLIVINYSDPSISSSDESDYVKKLVSGDDTYVMFHQQDYTIHIPYLKKWNRPTPAIFELCSKVRILEKLNEDKITFVSGHGGDHLFLAVLDPKFLTDSLLSEGFKCFYQRLKAMSKVKRRPMLPLFYSAIYSLFRYFFKIDTSAQVVQHKDFFSPKLHALMKNNIHKPPFLKDLQHVLPGKALHILYAYYATTIQGLTHLDLSEEVYPFLNHPIFELALAEPTYQTYNADFSRYHFRNIVFKHFNCDKVWRQSKGEISGVIQTFIRNDFTRILERCLEGRFAAHQLINRSLIHKQLHLMLNGYLFNLWPILRLLSAELWLEAWQIT